ncbi:hypothetical protein UAW_02789 [Enterococcus haemoperoxidus ATCC BAA-382]|uniref:Aminotransferase n=1 Tax=Enterococcus haemoperoxidus ATCC BAA-382 TaxID=1158608 RepID=R2SB42_9ENTE|nr:aminotransferase class I/II-fold pyridoxal phosphate-dependent enzyme [Enterococcus haemoperoxidus]EOH92750.1 hypothetical protein UAW_02789 [Enterococcus haemoperoxidus ATCC BAA-382]EOT61493.1 hypothetical protein I583_00473 [Enterococcus haemoperoxidus ATCC BAA-382]OJG55326.1 hypothetical protein RV06_GL001769 [Enterococcus haemoperoxidus]
MQGLILAAGLGSRMKEYTKSTTKSMVEVNGKSLIERMLRQLDNLDLERIVIVDGYKYDVMEEYVKSIQIKTPVVFVTNHDYDKTNNIYSVYLAKELMCQEDTILLESDLIFADQLLDEVLASDFKNLAVVSKFESWMDGTVVKMDENSNITDFIDKKRFNFNETRSYYKTVNIYKFSKEFSESIYFPFLEAQMSAFGKDEYYETTLKTITQFDATLVKALDIEDVPWYEIDDLQDLDVASSLFNTTPSKKLDAFQQRYGGYWRYPKVIDFCYLVNPFYPPKRMVDEMKSNMERLIIDYPSGLKVNSSLVAKFYNVPEKHVVVGNGAAELIKSLMEKNGGKYGIIAPTFEEYPNRLTKDQIVKYYPKDKNFQYTANDIMAFYSENPIDYLVLINPDNPTGNYIPKSDVITLLEWAKAHEITIILDESFNDFVDFEEVASLIDREILMQHPNLIIIKSISKSFGVPGVRLGFLMTSDESLVSYIKSDVSIWNINSFGEFFLQIFEKYKKDYLSALDLFYKIRKDFHSAMADVSDFEVIDSQANYFTCRLTGKVSARELATILLDQDKIFIKDLSGKDGFEGEYVRIAVKKSDENKKIIEALKRILNY